MGWSSLSFFLLRKNIRLPLNRKVIRNKNQVNTVKNSYHLSWYLPTALAIITSFKIKPE